MADSTDNSDGESSTGFGTNTSSSEENNQNAVEGFSFDYTLRTNALKKALGHANEAYVKSVKELKEWIIGWSVASFIVILVLVVYSCYMYSHGYCEHWSNRKFLYTIIFRFII